MLNEGIESYIQWVFDTCRWNATCIVGISRGYIVYEYSYKLCGSIDFATGIELFLLCCFFVRGKKNSVSLVSLVQSTTDVLFCSTRTFHTRYYTNTIILVYEYVVVGTWIFISLKRWVQLLARSRFRLLYFQIANTFFPFYFVLFYFSFHALVDETNVHNLLVFLLIKNTERYVWSTWGCRIDVVCVYTIVLSRYRLVK